MMAYSMDLKTRIMNEVQTGTLQLNEIAKLFKVDVKTIYRWRKRLHETNNFEAIVGYQKGHSHKITDLKLFEEFVKNNSDLTSTEMAKKWGNVEKTTIQRALKKIGFTLKKNNSFIKKKMRRKEKNL
jgi:transposase